MTHTQHQHRKPRILFLGEETTLSHVVRPLSLAEYLDRSEYAVLFACGMRYKSIVEQAGISWHYLPSISQKDFERRVRFSLPLYTEKDLIRYTEAEEHIIRCWRPDIIVSDFRFSAAATAKKFGIPHFNIADAHWGPYSTQTFPLAESALYDFFGDTLSRLFFPILLPLFQAWNFQAIKALYKYLELTPPKTLRHAIIAGDITLYPDIPSLAPTEHSSARCHYIGPILWAPNIPLPKELQSLRQDFPLIYVSMGSSGNTKVIDTILKALETLPVNVLLSTAGRFKLKHLPKNVIACPQVPALDILPKTALAICHGGSAATYQAFFFGVPVLGLPNNIPQFLTMEQVTKTYSGIFFRPSKVRRRDIREAVLSLLSDPKYRENALKLKDEILRYSAPKNFEHLLKEWFRKNPPLSSLQD